jgi:hypothetical protein
VCRAIAHVVQDGIVRLLLMIGDKLGKRSHPHMLANGRVRWRQTVIDVDGDIGVLTKIGQ